MIKSFTKYGLIAAVSVLIIFILFAVNQLIALYANLMAVNGLLANVVVITLSVLLLVLFSLPVIMLIRLPRSISFNGTESLTSSQSRLKNRLASNRYVKSAEIDINESGGLDKALELLDKEANEVINTTATAVFLTTAVSQNGKLDALTIFVTQAKMIWKVAHIYWQRPSFRDMVRLYSNVGGSALIASELEDIDITRQVQPIIDALLKSPGRSVPVVGHAAHIITDSLLEGSTNAFLTLRVGVLTLRYCGHAGIEMDKKELKKSAFREASSMLSTLVLKSSGKVVSSVMKAMKEAGKSTVRSGVQALGKAADSVKERLSKVTTNQKKSIPNDQDLSF